MRNCNVILIILLFFGYVTNAQNSKENRVEVVLLAGQSNMAGGGNYDELDEATKLRIEAVSDRVSLSFNGNPVKPLSYYDNKPSEKYPFLKRFGPELLLGVTLVEENPTKEFLLIKRSQGGTALYGSWNPDWTAEKAKAIEKGEKKQNLKLYNLHVADIRRNLDTLKAQGKDYRIYGLAWMQGENDAILEVAARGYNTNLKKLMQAYRTEFNTPEMPFVVGQINSRYGIKEGAEMVREGMFKAVDFDYYAALIETSTDTSWSDFPKHTDNVHYNTEGQKRLGTAFANGFISIEKRLNVAEFQSDNQLKLNNTIKFKAEGETNMMYHVYTPSNFTSEEKLPIVIAFSPNGKGLGMVTKMQEAAEKYGWIVVGCDKLKNGMNDEALEQQMEDEVLDDILKNIPHDTNKIYLAGFSGGAMRAYSLTTRRPENFEGIIAFGGWLGGEEYQDKAYQNEMYVAIVNGTNDKGANKWNEIDAKTLIKNNCIVKQFSFEGGHQVAPVETIEQVFYWLNNN
ncbi:sialate O-acetylesterase [Formosa sp. PL04]|uniref:sialate O-acetylesterase n=1 Tax=Formosa sp. PL04 TaxID=3081755 RepID=UPI002981B57F|nr:sialate O-acetylesterase [Formosa sp. PL04]MDW5288100.1 sialate O-acetylesterase [Formosa sp. PL04]